MKTAFRWFIFSVSHVEDFLSLTPKSLGPQSALGFN